MYNDIHSYFSLKKKTNTFAFYSSISIVLKHCQYQKLIKFKFFCLYMYFPTGHNSLQGFSVQGAKINFLISAPAGEKCLVAS